MSMIIDPYRFSPAGLTVNWSPQYDIVTGASVVGAWGLRKLVSGYTGPLVRIRDTTGGAEQDVGFGASGFLDAFTVTGNAAVVTLYDQSGNANHLTQSDTTKQPLVMRAGVSFSGRPAIRFDGSNDFLRDFTSGTSKAYMVPDLVVAVEAAGRGVAATWAGIALVPHIAGSNTSPYDRWGIRRYFSSSTSLQYSLTVASAETTTSTDSELAAQKSIGTVFLASHAGVALDGTVTTDAPLSPGDDITYPNATGIVLGANGAGAECFGGEITAVVVISNNTANAATVQTWHDNIHHKNLAKSADLVLDVSFTGGGTPADISDRAHPVWLSDGADVSAGYLDPTSSGAAVIAPSGLIAPSADFTFEAEVYLTSLTVNRRIASKSHRDTNVGWCLSTHDVNADELMVIAGNQYLVTAEHGTAANLTTGVWYTVRVTRSGNNWNLYVDGVSRAALNFSPTTPMYTGTPLLIGNNSLRTLPFPGHIRNVKMWSGVALAP